MSKKHFESLPKNTANYVPLTPLSFLQRTSNYFGDHCAVVYGEQNYSWKDVYERSCALASVLAERGVGEGDTVSIIAPNIPALIDVHFGVPMLGAVLNTINIRLEASTVGYILEHSDCKLLIVDSQFYSTAKQVIEDKSLAMPIIVINDALSGIDVVKGEEDYETALAKGDINFEWSLPKDEWQALTLNYTSGTSGKPKGVVYHHRGSYLMSMGTASAWQLPMHPVYLYTVPLFHCNGWGHAWTVCMMAGTIVCCRVVSAAFVFDAVVRYQVTHFGGAPIVLGLLVNAAENEKKTISHAVKVMTAGAPPPPAILGEMEKIGFDVMQVYGLTETYGHITHCLWKDKWNGLNEDERSEIKSWQGISFPMTDAVELIENETGAFLPKDSNQQGEMLIRGNTVMKGYYKNPEETAKAFVDGWFHTGDAAMWREDGYLQIQDRLKDVIISGGENISSVEIEAVLYAHPAIANAAIVAKKDLKWGEVPCAFVELKEGVSIEADEIIAFCRERLAGFKTPKHVLFQELPKTATGKIQKFILRDQLK